MTDLARVLALHRTRQDRLTAAGLLGMRRLWAATDTSSEGSRSTFLDRSAAFLTTILTSVATTSGLYARDALDAQGLGSTPLGVLVPSAFASSTSQGFSLGTMVLQGLMKTDEARAAGLSATDAHRAGGTLLDSLTMTEVADTGRDAELAVMYSEPDSDGFIRMIEGNACSRCVILSGRFYRVSDGFQRHPRCGCKHVPTARATPTAQDVRRDPQKYFESLSEAEQDKAFGKEIAQKIRDGEDMNKLVNAQRGTSTSSRLTPKEEQLIKRGRSRPKGKWTPEQIATTSRSRQEGIDGMIEAGYLRAA